MLSPGALSKKFNIELFSFLTFRAPVLTALLCLKSEYETTTLLQKEILLLYDGYLGNGG